MSGEYLWQFSQGKILSGIITIKQGEEVNIKLQSQIMKRDSLVFTWK